MRNSEGREVVVLVDVEDKYSQPRKMEVPVSEADRKYSKRMGREVKTKIIEQRLMFAAKGEKVLIVGDHDNVMIIQNSRGNRCSVTTDKLDL